MATTRDITRLLSGTTIPGPVIEGLVSTASPLWLMSAPAAVLAKDLVLCYPPLDGDEVRAVAQPLDDGLVRLTVVARDRHAFLANTAAVLAKEAVSVVSASVVTWEDPEVALHALTVRAGHLTTSRWDELGARLRSVAAGEEMSVDFRPTGRPHVTCSPATGDRWLLSVTADDQVGLLWAISRSLADNGVSIESAHIDEAGGRASDRFVVLGEPDVGELRARLTAPSRHTIRGLAAGAGRLPWRVARGLLGR